MPGDLVRIDIGVKPINPISRRNYKIPRELSEFAIVIENNNHVCQVCLPVPGFHKYPSLQSPQDCIVHINRNNLTLLRRSGTREKERFLRFSIGEITTTFYIERTINATPTESHKQEAIEAQQTEYTTSTIIDQQEVNRRLTRQRHARPQEEHYWSSSKEESEKEKSNKKIFKQDPRRSKRNSKPRRSKRTQKKCNHT